MPVETRKSFSTGKSPHAYQLYGLRLRSNFSLPCRDSPERTEQDVELFEGSPSLFSRASRHGENHQNAEQWFRHYRLADGSTYLRWSGLFEFLLSPDGRQIACRSLNGTSREAFHNYLLGQVLSFALLQLGIEPLHATAVVVNGEAVGFMGDCGYGKSSLGAAFLQVGYPILTDDLLVVREEGNGFSAFSGIPRIKLFPKIAKSLLGERIIGLPMNNDTPKLIIPLNSEQSNRGVVPLKAIYALMNPAANSRSKSIAIRQLTQRRAFLEMLKGTFNDVVVDTERLKRQFILTTRVASKVPVKLLSYPKTLSLLPAVRDEILSDLNR